MQTAKLQAGAFLAEHLCINVNATEVLCESWSPGELSYRKDGVPVIGKLLSEMHQSRTIQYHAKRNQGNGTSTNAAAGHEYSTSTFYGWRRRLGLGQLSGRSGAAAAQRGGIYTA